MAKIIHLPFAGGPRASGDHQRKPEVHHAPVEDSPTSRAAGAKPPVDGISYRVAARLDQVLAAWSLVHDCAVDQGIIVKSPSGIHTNLHAASPGSTVFLAERGAQVVSTVTTTRDGLRGLALDATYGRELDKLRTAGHRLVEIGLLAHRSDSNGLERLLAISVDYALRNDFGVVMAVPAHHAGFFNRAYGFAAVECRRSLAPRRRPESLLHLRRDVLSGLHSLPKALKTLGERPVRSSFYAGAFSFLASQTAGSVLDGYFDASATAAVAGGAR